MRLLQQVKNEVAAKLDCPRTALAREIGFFNR